MWTAGGARKKMCVVFFLSRGFPTKAGIAACRVKTSSGLRLPCMLGMTVCAFAVDGEADGALFWWAEALKRPPSVLGKRRMQQATVDLEQGSQQVYSGNNTLLTVVRL